MQWKALKCPATFVHVHIRMCCVKKPLCLFHVNMLAHDMFNKNMYIAFK